MTTITIRVVWSCTMKKMGNGCLQACMTYITTQMVQVKLMTSYPLMVTCFLFVMQIKAVIRSAYNIMV